MAKVKFYAVRVGRKPGIYNSWDECEEQTKGFHGAEYKSFTDINEANNYMCPQAAKFMDTCPVCGYKGALEVESCVCHLKGVILESDGFVIQQARRIDTHNEIIRCGRCNTDFSLNALTIKG